MKKTKEMTPRYVRVNAGVKAYSSAMHGELHQQLYNLIAAQDKQKLHLTDELLKAWNDLIMQEVELNNAQQDTELTAKMQQLDDDRDALLSQLFSTIRNNRRSPAMPQAARRARLRRPSRAPWSWKTITGCVFHSPLLITEAICTS